MTIAVFGGTGKTGRQAVAQALAASHKVRVLARDPDKIPPAFGLEFVAGDALDGGRVMATLAGCDAAIVALGPVKGGPVDVCSRVTDLILQAATKTGTKKVVVLTSLGVGDSQDDVPWVFRVVMGLFLKAMLQDKDKQEALVRASPLDWTVVRPTGLTDDPPAGTWLAGTGKLRDSAADRKPTGRISRTDVGAFLVDCVTNPAASRTTWYLTN